MKNLSLSDKIETILFLESEPISISDLAKNLEIKEYINIFSKVTERIFIEKDKYIKKVTLEEKKETSKLNNHIARWIPPSTINVSMLNTRERWYNQINSEFDLIHYGAYVSIKNAKYKKNN